MAHLVQLGFLIVLLVQIRIFVDALEPGCASPLGLISGSLADWQLSASSSSPDSDAQPKYGRLYASPSHAWCANARSDNGHHWLLVDLGVDTWVAGLIVQGREGGSGRTARTTAFSISYAHAGAPKGAWTYVEDVYGAKKVFEGNYGGTPGTTRTVWLEKVLHTRFVRVHLLEWVGAPCLRLELLGCQECSSIVSGPGSGTRITASTSAAPGAKYHHHQDPTGEHQISCQPEDGHLESHSGWCPAPSHNDVHQWLQFEFSAPTLVTGIVTRGHGARSARVWVTGYTISYSNDSVVWYTYRDGHTHHTPKIFGGNMDRDTERRHYLNAPVACRVLRLHPVHWHGTIGMRAGVIGCPVHPHLHPHKNGDPIHNHGHSHTKGIAKIHNDYYNDVCPEGFFRLNPLAPCFENLAWRKEVWTNDKKHFWHAHEWKHGHASRAVNGGTKGNDTTHAAAAALKRSHTRTRPLSQCAVLDNYYTEEPVWMVDLGRKREITGVVLITWQGEEDEPGSNGEGHHENVEVDADESGNHARANIVSYREYVASLEDITVYVSNSSRVERLEEEDVEAEGISGTESLSCGTISRENNAIFAPKLYYECGARGHVARARYVYLKPKPALSRWTRRIFNFVICQVFVY